MQKYKVFLNEKLISFAIPGEITLAKEYPARPCFSSVAELARWLEDFASGIDTEAVIEHENPEDCFRNFRSSLLEMEAAGGVVLRGGKLLFIFRNGKWDLPKGKIDLGENPGQAALREVAEECGIVGHRISRSLDSTFHLYRSPYKETIGKWIFKETHWFEMEYNGIQHGEPETEEGITEVRWFSPSELDIVLQNTYANLIPIVNAYRS